MTAAETNGSEVSVPMTRTTEGNETVPYTWVGEVCIV